ncbi:dual E2 ubiquitin-conjugating enzyme/E3 ubiquitin-protein ligase BIRC6-like isoform X2 [Glandiceps talaboti]
MAAMEWSVSQDGCLSVGEQTCSVTFHPKLNTVLAVTHDSTVQVIDVNSGVVLQKSTLSGKPGGRIQCMYLAECDKLFVTDGQGVGLRRDLSGVLLLDTALQVPVSRSEDMVKVELSASEASQLLTCLKKTDLPGVEFLEDVVEELENGLKGSTQQDHANHKLAKWASVCLNLPFCALRSVCNSLITELKRSNQHVPSLSVASAILDRLAALYPAGQPEASHTTCVGGRAIDRSLMYSEAARRETFGPWPHMNYKYALPDAMAQAGFYHQPTSAGDDRAMCFTCSVCLVCWEPTDEPWSEHERHSANCPFVRGEFTQNVPISVTLASGPAQLHADGSQEITCVSPSSCQNLMVTSSVHGNVSIWDVSRQLKLVKNFNIDPKEPLIMHKLLRKAPIKKPIEAWGEPKGEDQLVVKSKEADKEVKPSAEGKSAEDKTNEASGSVQIIDVSGAWKVQIDKENANSKETGKASLSPPSEDILVTSLCVVNKPDKSLHLPIASEQEKNTTCVSPSLFVGTLVSKSTNPAPSTAVNSKEGPQSDKAKPNDSTNSVVDSSVNSSSKQQHVPCILVYDTASKSHIGKSEASGTSKGVSSFPPPPPPSTVQEFYMPQILEVEDQQIYIEEPMSFPETAINASFDTVDGIGSEKKVGGLVQCIELPDMVTKNSMCISQIVPTLDNTHMIVVAVPTVAVDTINQLGKECNVGASGQNDLNKDSTATTDSSEVDSTLTEATSIQELDSVDSGGFLLLYKLSCSHNTVVLEEQPVAVHEIKSLGKMITSLIVLPPEACDMSADEETATPEERMSTLEKGKIEENGFTTMSYSLGQLVATTWEGGIVIMDIGPFTTLAEIPARVNSSATKLVRSNKGEQFVSLTYCSGMERMCACRANGELCFFQVCARAQDLDVDDVGSLEPVDEQKAADESSPGAGIRKIKDVPGNDLLIKQPLSPENLSRLVELTKFETLVPRFTAAVPPCWTEVQQEQQQRRHPQHLHRLHHGDATQHTRTWRLQPDSLSWKEHLFEVVLPKPCSVGHVDVKFTLHHMCDFIPKVQVTLLKQNSTNIGRSGSGSSIKENGTKKKTLRSTSKSKKERFQMNISETTDQSKGTPLDDEFNVNIDQLGPKETKEQNIDIMENSEAPPDFSSTSSSSSNQGSESESEMKSTFLEKHRIDVICGPIDINSSMDMSGRGGLITMTSQDLLKMKSRSFLLHIQATESPENEANTRKKMSTTGKGASITSAMNAYGQQLSATERLAASSPNKEVDNYHGCDWIQELSVTIRRTKRTSVPRDRIQRVKVLEHCTFHERLIQCICAEDTSYDSCVSFEHYQGMALDILCWIAGVQISEPVILGSDNLVFSIQRQLLSLIKTCIIEADRSIAHKFSQLVALCTGRAKRSKDTDILKSFNMSLLHAMLECLSLIPCANSAGSLHWFFVLLNLVKSMDPENTGKACASMLTAVARQLHERMTPQHLLLRARFGLYGTPLEPVLFETEPITPSKPSTTTSTTSTSTTSSSSTTAQQTQPHLSTLPGDIEVDFKELLGMSNNSKPSSSSSIVDVGTQLLKGLLEVEPLHFTCVATSEGTHVEKVDTGGNTNPTVIPTTLGPGPSVLSEHTTTTSAPGAAMSALSGAMASAEQQLQLLQQKQQQLMKLQQQKQKLEEKLQMGSGPGNVSSAYQYSTELFPATPKNTPFFMTPPLTPPNEVLNAGEEGLYSLGKTFAKVVSQGVKSKSGVNKPSPSGTSLPPANQCLLQPPQPHVLVVERMHSGARRFAVLDFGRPVLLTDVFVPACTDLSSLSIDVWVRGEEIDGRRLVVAMDIGQRSLILSDLLPPAMCRYIKITVIGRYGGNTMRSKIPVGLFYGHTYILPWENEDNLQTPLNGGSFQENGSLQLDHHLGSLISLQEDLQCRYSLACNRLTTLLNGIDLPQSVGTSAQFFVRKNSEKSEEDNKIHQAYQECMQLQLQLNLAHRAISRVKSACGTVPSKIVQTQSQSALLKQTSTDQLRVIAEYLLDTLLSICNSSLKSIPSTLFRVFDLPVCEALFKHLCVSGTPKTRIRCGALLVKMCGVQPWWGEFLANALQEYFNSEQTIVFPQDRLFVLLAVLGQKSIACNNSSNVLEHLLNLLAKLLAPLQSSHGQYYIVTGGGSLDLSLISWVLLFLSRTLDSTVANNASNDDEEGDLESKSNNKDKDKGGASNSVNGNRWDFITSDFMAQSNQPVGVKSVNHSRLHKRRLKRQLMHHKQQLMDLQAKHKMISSQLKEEGKGQDIVVQQKLMKELKQRASKHFKDLLMLRRMTNKDTVRGDKDDSNSQGDRVLDVESPVFQLPRDKSIPVVQGLMALLLSMDFTCHVDLFLVTCKVLARISNASRPAITLPEIMNEQQLEQLLLLCVGSNYNRGNVVWGGPWAYHAITTLLLDVLEGEKMYPISALCAGNVTDEDISVALSTDTEEGLEPSGASETEKPGTSGASASAASGTSQSKEGATIEDVSESDPQLADFDDMGKKEFMEEMNFLCNQLHEWHPSYEKSKSKLQQKAAYIASMSSALAHSAAALATATANMNHSVVTQSAKYHMANHFESDPTKAVTMSSTMNVSMAMDARLEVGLQLRAEWFLKIVSVMEADSVVQALNAPLLPLPGLFCAAGQGFDSPQTDDALFSSLQAIVNTSSVQMLSGCFDHLFSVLHMQQINLDLLLQLWLTLNENSPDNEKNENCQFDATVVPSIPLSQSSVSSLLGCLAWQYNVQVHTWCLSFHTLALLANMKVESTGNETVWMANAIVADSNLLPALMKFLSSFMCQGTTLTGQTHLQVGPSATQAMYEFLMRLQVRCTSSEPSTIDSLKELMLKLVVKLTVESGAFQTGQGPLDAQVKLLDYVLEQKYQPNDISTAVSLIEAVTALVHNHIKTSDQLTCRSSSEGAASSRSCFGGLFASMLRPGDSKSTQGEASRDMLMCYLLRLVSHLVEVPLKQEPMSQISHVSSSLSNDNIAGSSNTRTAPQSLPVGDNLPDADKLSAGQTPLQSPTSSLSDEEKKSEQDQHQQDDTSSQSEQQDQEAKKKPTRCSHSIDGEETDAPKEKCITDIILGKLDTVLHLLGALSYCNSNTMAMIIGSSGLSQVTMTESFNSVDPFSIGDSVFQVLCILNKRATTMELMLRPVLKYLSCGVSMRMKSTPLLSEPLLWFVLRTLDCEQSLRAFNDIGGIEVICNNLVLSNRSVINVSPSLVSTIMQYLGNGGKAPAPVTTKSSKNTSIDADPSDGLHNFAPYGSITSSSPTAQPADVLLQSQPPHRRARSAAWSYHFYPDESWCDLTISLPSAILLKEIQIQPHLTSLATCPASVSIEISRDGSTMIPVSSPISTSGLTFIKLQLYKPEVTTSVCLRLHKPRDSSTVGLSQIMLLGLTAFGSTASSNIVNPFLPTEDNVSKSSVGWLRILHHCLTQVSAVEQLIGSAAAPIPNLLTTCCALLLSPHCNVYASNIESVLLKIALHNTDIGLQIIDILLRNNYCTADPDNASSLLGRLHGTSSDSTVDIIYQLGTTQDQGTIHRVKALVDWLGDTARVALQKHGREHGGSFQRAPRTLSPAEQGLSMPSAAHVHCVSVIIWKSYEKPVEYDLPGVLTRDLFSSVYEWSMVLPHNSILKRAVDSVLSAICHVQPKYFNTLLEWMGIVMEGDQDISAPLTDDSKDASRDRSSSLTDDTKEATQVGGASAIPIVDIQPLVLMEFGHMILDEAHLQTLAVACQSPTAIKQLLKSGFPAVLAQALLEFCTREIARNIEGVSGDVVTDSTKILTSPRSPRGRSRTSSTTESDGGSLCLTADLIAPVLKFFAEVAYEDTMKAWLGGEEGNIFWPALLTLLCNTSNNAVQPMMYASPKRSQVLSTQHRASIETATVKYFCKVISAHPANQQLGANVLCEVIRSKSSQTSMSGSAISGFTRRLFLQLMLEDEKLLAFIDSPCQLYKGRTNAAANIVRHPRYGTGHKFRTHEVKLSSTCGDVLSMVSDTPQLTAKLIENREKRQKEETKAEEKKEKESLEEEPQENGALEGLQGSMEVLENLSVAAGMKVKSKRADKTAAPRPPSRRGKPSPEKPTSSEPMNIPVLSLYHHLIPGQALPNELTVAQLLVLLQERGLPQGFPSLDFSMKLSAKRFSAFSKSDSAKRMKTDQDEEMEIVIAPPPDQARHEPPVDPIPDSVLLETPSLPSVLQVFASMGGLALIAEHLPLLFPEISRQASGPTVEKGSESAGLSGQSEAWVTVEQNEDELYEDLLPPAPPSTSSASTGQGHMSSLAVPPHSLAAFGLFLRLPGYAEVLLKERKKAQCLLRLVLGVTDDGDGGHILSSPLASSLPTLPFHVLKTLFDSTPLTTDDGVLLRQMTLDIGAIHLILACLAVLSHHGPRVSAGSTAQHETQPQQPVHQSSTEKSQNYWAKGTGFGTGSTTSGWDVEQALNKQKAEEEHVTCLLQVLASYVNPGGEGPDDDEDLEWGNMEQLRTIFPVLMIELLDNSCLIPAISSYLRNDSVLDISRHVPLYRALLELLRGMALCPLLVPLLLPLQGGLDSDDEESGNDSSVSVSSLLEKMQSCVDTYTSRLKSNKEKITKGRKPEPLTAEEESESEGLALLVPDLKHTMKIVFKAIDKLKTLEGKSCTDGDDTSQNGRSLLLRAKVSLEERYIEIMKDLQFDTYEMITEDSSGKLNFNVSHRYASNIKSAGDVSNAARARRLAQEAVTLSTSLPLSASSSVFVRCDEDRLDVMKVFITGPSDTPYCNGCFEFDVYFPQDYPQSPMLINLETTGQNSVRFNPNLYNDGKVCLSVLNTWHGRPEEKWNSQTSSFLQVLVSIQSLILVNEPYFNEPGYERSRGTPSGTQSSREYDANIRQATVKWAMLEMIRNPPPCFKEVIVTHFYLKKHEVMSQCDQWIQETQQYCNDKRVGRTMSHHLAALKRHTAQLREELAKLKKPECLGVDDDDDTDSDVAGTNLSKGSESAVNNLSDPGDQGKEDSGASGSGDDGKSDLTQAPSITSLESSSISSNVAMGYDDIDGKWQ